MIRGDVVAHLQENLRLNFIFQRVGFRERLDVRSPKHFRILRLFRRQRRNKTTVINPELLRYLYLSYGFQGRRIRDISRQSGSRCGFRAHQVHLSVLGSGAAQEVSVKGPQTHAAGIRGKAHSDAWTAGALQNPGTGINHIRQSAALRQHGKHLAGPRGNSQADAVGDFLSLQHSGYLQHIRIGGIGTGSDGNLIHLYFLQFVHRLHVVRAVRTCRQRFQLAQINGVLLCVYRIFIAGQRNPIRFPVLGFEEFPSLLIRWKNRGGGTQLRTHIGDGAPFRHAEGLNSFPAVLHDGTHAALYGQLSQHFQNHILGAHIVAQPVLQVHPNHTRHRNVIRTAAHGNRHVHSAGTHGQHTQTAAGRCVRIGTDQCLSRFSDAFILQLMADTVSRTGEPDTVLCCNALDVPVIVRILETGLQCIMIDIGHGPLRPNLIHAHGFKLQIRHGSGGILGQRLIDSKTNLFPGLHFPGKQMLFNNLLRNCLTHFYCSPSVPISEAINSSIFLSTSFPLMMDILPFAYCSSIQLFTYFTTGLCLPTRCSPSSP